MNSTPLTTLSLVNWSKEFLEELEKYRKHSIWKFFRCILQSMSLALLPWNWTCNSDAEFWNTDIFKEIATRSIAQRYSKNCESHCAYFTHLFSYRAFGIQISLSTTFRNIQSDFRRWYFPAEILCRLWLRKNCIYIVGTNLGFAELISPMISNMTVRTFKSEFRIYYPLPPGWSVIINNNSGNFKQSIQPTPS